MDQREYIIMTHDTTWSFKYLPHGDSTPLSQNMMHIVFGQSQKK
jgi:hypothetical protein